MTIGHARLGSVTLLAALLSGRLGAQVCAGFPSLDGTRYRAAPGIDRHPYATTVGGTFMTGRDVFGALSAGRTHDPELDASSWDLAVEAGVDIADSVRRFFLCPVATISAILGPRDFLLSEDDYRALAAGLGLGGAAIPLQSRSFTVIVAWSGRIVGMKVSHTFLAPEKTTRTASDAYGLLMLAVGFRFGDILTIRPRASVPFGLADPNRAVLPLGLDSWKPSFGISAAIGFGKRPTRSQARTSP